MPILAEDAPAMCTARAAYAFPRAAVLMAHGPPDEEFGGIFPFQFGAIEGVTDPLFDAALHAMLTSHEEQERQRGLATVVYWGNLTAGYCRHRVGRLVTPTTANRLPLASPQTLQRLGQCTAHLAQHDYGLAAAALHGVSQLSYLAFGSKVVAFLAPSDAAVLDAKIMSALQHWAGLPGDGLRERLGAWAHQHHVLLRRMNRPTTAQSVILAYQNWCEMLGRATVMFNAAGSTWTDLEGVQNPWRAVDVERAIFNLASN